MTFHAPWARFLGLAILLAATAFTLWARFALGLMWSAVPAVKEGHRLRTSGPYAITRHPRRVPQLVPGLRVVTRHQEVAG